MSEALAARLTDALFTGRILVERRVVDSLTERDFDPGSLPPLPPAKPESADTFFEVRFVDEIGQALSGLDVELDTDGEPHDVTTNAAGVALVENVLASSGSVKVADPKALDELLEPRWTKRRSGKAPSESNTTTVVFEGDPVGPLPVKPAIPNTVVLAPPLGELFVELFDKTGRVRHAKRSYTIDGPQQLSGTTDENGRLVHVGVFPGDYTLSLTLEFFEDGDPDRQIDTVESPLVVLAPGAGTPEVRRLGVVPRSSLARLNLFFNTNKTFLLPTALPEVKKLRKLYLDNAPCELLVVGHADTSGASDYNDKLSLERAEATIAYLEDDVDGWYKFYSDSEKSKRWGKTEDHLMITAMPGFADKPKGQDPVRWFQETRGLDVDGKAGSDTRHALIAEYMSLDGASLSEFVGEIEATAHGCGENFPLDDSGDELDDDAPDDERDPIDRRVELFFFDPEFGITPPPPGQNSKPGSVEYPLWRKRVVETIELTPGDADLPEVVFVEIADAHFRTDSAVVLPEGENPDDKGDHQALTSVGLIATALRFNDEHPGKTVFVAGHTDTTAGDDVNDELSRQRAKVGLALLEGDRDSFRTLCNSRHQGADINQILSWVSEAFEDLSFDCKPAAINAVVNDKTVRAFQRDYNANKAAMGLTTADLDVDGDVGELTWGAFFDCYEFALQQELGEDAAGVASLRAELEFADDARKSLGFGEHFPIEELGADNFRSQTNRRVEILFFEPGEEPDLEHAEDDPETSELYLPGFFERTPIEPMLSARRKRIFIQFVDGTGANLGELSYRLEVDDGSVFENTSLDATVDHRVSEAATSAKLFLDDTTVDISIGGA